MSSPQNILVHSAIPSRVVVALIVPAFAAFYAYTVSTLARTQWILFFTMAFVVLAVHIIRKQPRSIELNVQADLLTVHYRSWFGKRSAVFVLSHFSVVCSYSRGAPLPITIVELSTTEDLPRVIRIATYEEPTSKEAGFLAIPRFVEAPKAAALRSQLAATGLFHDTGYRGEFLSRRAQEVA